jgi:hypothetical protein
VTRGEREGKILDIGKRLDLKVERAKKHVIDLESAWSAFLKTNPYEIVPKDDPQAAERTYFLRQAKEIPSNISLIIGDVLQNLRSALDHVAYHLAVVNSASAKTLATTYFPIFPGPVEYHAGKGRKIDGLRQDAVKAIDSVEPYGGGKGDLLWVLHTLNNVDKHKLLLTALPDLAAHSISPSQFAKGNFPKPFPMHLLPGVLVAPSTKSFPLKAGDPLLTITHAEMQNQMQFKINPAFENPRIVRGKPVFWVLHEMIMIVRRIVLVELSSFYV